MKKLNQYQCETCNTIYKSEQECLTCEKSHAHCKEIEYEIFNSYKNDGGYPKKIRVKMSNGTYAEFSFSGVYTPR